VGDCYVAATGIPEQRPDHAEVMVKFARTCLIRVNELTKSLESQLGPGTADLAMRIGMHSGPVTAGVLRGQKARFQLFGDTMNMGARMETTGVKNKVHLSQDTASILISSGKQHWLSPRQDLVHVKGKGSMQTYWLLLGSSSASVTSSEMSEAM
jgi:class 3 adenylate cyclase